MKIGNGTTEWFKTNVGVRQGCTLSPDLFNLFLEKILTLAIGENLEGLKLNGTTVNNLRFADDIALISDSPQGLQQLTEEVNEKSLQFGLRINIDKTKVMKSGVQNTSLNIKVQDDYLEQVENFVYLGGKINQSGKDDTDISRRIGLASMAFGKMTKIWRSREMTWNTKRRVYETIILPVLLYGSECWTLRKADEDKLLMMEMGWLRVILGVSRLQRLRNEEVRKMIGLKSTVVERIQERRLRWFGHVSRMDINRLPNKALHMKVMGRRNRGRPRMRWIDKIKEDIKSKLETSGQTMESALGLTKERDKWRAFIRPHRHR